MTNALVQLDSAVHALAEAKNLSEVKKILDIAQAAATYAKAAKMGLEAQNYAAEVKILAECKAGEMLSQLKRADVTKTGGPGRGKNGSNVGPVSEYAEALKMADVTKQQANRMQTEAAVPAAVRDAHIADAKKHGKEVTTTGVLKLAKAIKQEQRRTKGNGIYIPPAPKSPTLLVGRAESLEGVATHSVDIIITSPPYNLGAENWPMGGNGRTPRDGIGYEAHDDSMSQDEYERWQIEVFRALYRVAKPGASFFYNHKTRPLDGRLIHPMRWVGAAENPWTLRQEIIWDRGSTHNHSAAIFWPEDERVYWMTKGKPALPDRSIGQSTIWHFHGPVADTWHPAPFSDELPRRCLQAIAHPGQVVLDPFAGSCTTLAVALEMGCDAIGVDVSLSYLEHAAKERGWTIPNAI